MTSPTVTFARGPIEWPRRHTRLQLNFEFDRLRDSPSWYSKLRWRLLIFLLSLIVCRITRAKPRNYGFCAARPDTVKLLVGYGVIELPPEKMEELP